MSAISRLERRLQKLRALLRQREIFAEQAIDDVTVEAIKTKMFAANYSIRIIDNVEIRDVIITEKRIKYTIINELLVGNNFDIGEGREKGIPAHDIFGNPILAFKMSTIIGSPVQVFAHHVKHPGVEASHIIRDTVREKKFEVQERYKLLVNNKVQEIKNSS